MKDSELKKAIDLTVTAWADDCIKKDDWDVMTLKWVLFNDLSVNIKTYKRKVLKSMSLCYDEVKSI
jgi:hypothetical protein